MSVHRSTHSANLILSWGSERKAALLSIHHGQHWTKNYSSSSSSLAAPPWRTCSGYFLLFTGRRWHESLRTPAVEDCLKQWHGSGYIISFLLISFTKWLVLFDACVSCWVSQTEAHPKTDSPLCLILLSQARFCFFWHSNNTITRFHTQRCCSKNGAKLCVWHRAGKCSRSSSCGVRTASKVD